VIFFLKLIQTLHCNVSLLRILTIQFKARLMKWLLLVMNFKKICLNCNRMINRNINFLFTYNFSSWILTTKIRFPFKHSFLYSLFKTIKHIIIFLLQYFFIWLTIFRWYWWLWARFFIIIFLLILSFINWLFKLSRWEYICIFLQGWWKITFSFHWILEKYLTCSWATTIRHLRWSSRTLT